MKKDQTSHRPGSTPQPLSEVAACNDPAKERLEAAPQSVSIGGKPSTSCAQPSSETHKFETAQTLNRFGKLL